jgi:hypothetical protein
VFIEPEDGFQANKPCTLRVSGEVLRQDARKTVLFTVYSRYGDNETVNEYIKHDAVLREGVAELEIPYLPLNEQYHRDKKKPEDASYEVWFEVEPLKYGEKVVSGKLVLPVREDGAEITFLDEDGRAFDGISLLAKDGRETRPSSGKAVIGCTGDEIEISFPELAMNYHQSDTAGIA